MRESVTPATRADVWASAIFILDVIPALRGPTRVAPDPMAALADPPSIWHKPSPYGGQVAAAQFVQDPYHGRRVNECND